MDEIGFYDKCGFLSQQYQKEILERNTNSQIVKLVYKINEEIYNLYENIVIYSNDVKSVYCLNIFSFIHKTFQSVIILAERGLENEAYSLLRNMLEEIFKMKAVYNDEENMKILIDDYNHNRNSMINLINTGVQGLENLQNKIKDITIESGKRITKEELARKAGMIEEYNLIYRLLSDYQHISMSLLEKGLDADENNLKSISIGPIYNDLEVILIHACDFIRYGLDIISDYTDISKIDTLYKKLEDIKKIYIFE